jgi:trans-2,3-dihydro-3-hydroxyanthranilate isomerase
MRYPFYTADVFTGRIFGGNPLAVFPEADGLSPALMQQIAGELNLSETAFVTPPEDPAHTCRVRIFTPKIELPFAGHPTVGTAFVLTATGRVTLSGEQTRLIFEEGVGAVRVDVHAREGRSVSARLWAAKMPEFGPQPPDRAKLARLLSLEEEAVLEGRYAPQAVSCGVPFTFIPLRDREALGRARLDLAVWKQLLANFWAPHIYCLALDPEVEGHDLRARMFAPAMGIEEDPATGAAASALAGYLGSRETMQDGMLRWVVEQGFEIGRPSVLEVEADVLEGEIVAVRVGGGCVMVSEGVMKFPDKE